MNCTKCGAGESFIGGTKIERTINGLCHECTAKERDQLKEIAEGSQKACAKTIKENFKLKGKLTAAQKACAEKDAVIREWIEQMERWQGPGQPHSGLPEFLFTSYHQAKDALSLDCGKDFAHKSEVK